jgi:predicted nucleotidyltransferase component of viral defense system
VTEPTQGDTEGTFAYLSAPAFDNALRDLFVAAASIGTYGVNELRRQFAYDRFLTRVFSDDTDRWILKGGGGLLARMPGQARHSMDLDLFYQGQLDLAISTLQTVAAVDFGDFFSFDVEPGPAKDNGRARQLAIKAFLGNKEFQRFKIDLVVSSNMTQRPDTVAPLTPVNIPGLQLHPYRVYAIVDHLADKLAAMVEQHNGQPSSRYRDLVDIVLVANTHRFAAADLGGALRSEFTHRRIQLPATIELPAPAWTAGYEIQALKIKWLPQQTVTQALHTARALFDPILTNQAIGNWEPTRREWIDPSNPDS